MFYAAKVVQFEDNTKKASFFFIVKMQPTLFKVSAKFRLSETNENFILICEREEFIQNSD